MARAPMEALLGALYIAEKDAKAYYFKAPNFTYALLMPISLFIAFSIAGPIDPKSIAPGLTSLVILFGTTSIEAVAVVLERQTGTFERLLVAPVSLSAILLGKILAGLLFGSAIGIAIFVSLALALGIAVASPPMAILAIALSSLSSSALGVLASAHAKWVPEAQMLANFLRFPMAFLSGAFIPLELMPSQLRFIARLLPLTYSVEALRISAGDPMAMPIYLLDALVLALYSLAFLTIATYALKKKIE
ncbi:MAG: ABC transporter permease [Candidatus Bathyarchaeia archaeon]